MATVATINQIEQQLVTTLSNISDIKKVISTLDGDIGSDKTLRYPACLVLFTGESLIGDNRDPLYTSNYTIIFFYKSERRDESTIKTNAHSILESIRSAIHKKTLGLNIIKPFIVESVTIESFDQGIITYSIDVTTERRLLDVTS